MKHLALLLCLLFPGIAAAQALPALYDVIGVAADDVLNIRAAPSASASIIGGLAQTATGVEVVAFSADGKWAQVNTHEASGWSSLRFLRPQGRPDWFALRSDLRCFGTEPFWSFYLDAAQETVHLNTPDEEGPEQDILSHWLGSRWQPVAAMQFASDGGGGMAVLRAQACSDGMSDRAFGLTLDLFLQKSSTGPAASLHGCCSLMP